MPFFPSFAQSLGLLTFGLAAMLGSMILLDGLGLPVMLPVLMSSVLGSFAALGLGVMVSGRSFGDMVGPCRHRSAGWVALLPILVGALLVASQLVNLAFALWPPPAFFTHLMDKIGRPSNPTERALTLILAGALAPMAEELLFRGLIQRGLTRRYGARAGIGLTAVLFATYHLNPWQGIAALQLGLLLGWLTHRSGYIAYAVALHCGNNLAALLAADLSSALPSGAAGAEGAAFLPPGWLLAASLILVWGLVRFSRSFPAPQPSPAPSCG